MAVLPERPYEQFNFLVHFGGSSRAADAGFQEISGIELEAPHSARVTKLTGINKSTDITLKRGVVAAPGFQEWLDDVSAGNQKAVRDVTIEMQNEDHTVGRTLKLVRARIIKHTSGPFNAKGTDVAMEELVLAGDRLEVKD
ncbi:MAG: phage tail protein [Gemmatimonadota bacterium]